MVPGGRRQACCVLFLMVVATACVRNPAGADAPTFQLRPVVEIVSSSSPGPDAPDPTCDGEDEDAAACLAAHASESVVVLDTSNTETYVLGTAVVDGADVAGATARQDPAAGWSVIVDLTPQGSDALEAATRASVGDRIAILVDGDIVSAPTVQTPIGSGSVVAASGLSEAEANDLAARLGGG